MNTSMLQTEPSTETAVMELPVMDEITKESHPEMYSEMKDGKGDDGE